MYVPLYTAKGVLTAPLRTYSKVLSVDGPLRDKLIALGDNYTYLKLTGEAGVEIVKVYGTDKGAYIQRGIDNTEALEFNAGDTVEYTLTVAEIEDSVSAIPLVINVVDGLRRLIDIEYIPLNWIAFGATEFVGEYPDLVIGRDEQAYGCCDGNNTPDRLPAVPFYLTSRPYPIESIDAIQTTGAFVSEKILSWGVEAASSAAAFVSVVIFTLQRFYTGKPEAYDSAASFVSATITTVLRTYTSPAEACDTNASFVSCTINTVLIYTETVDEALDTSATFIGAVIT